MDPTPPDQINSSVNTSVQKPKNSFLTLTSVFILFLVIVIILVIYALFLTVKQGSKKDQAESNSISNNSLKITPTQQVQPPQESLPCLDDTIYTSIKDALQKKPEEVCTINLVGQNLSELPPEITSFKNLVTLGLGKNKFTTIPKELEKLKSLKNLGIASNNISSLPSDPSFLSSLKIIDISENPLTEDEISIFRKALPKTEIRYLKKMPNFIQPK